MRGLVVQGMMLVFVRAVAIFELDSDLALY